MKKKQTKMKKSKVFHQQYKKECLLCNKKLLKLLKRMLVNYKIHYKKKEN